MKIGQKGNRVVFDSECSFIRNKSSGVVTKIEDRDGALQFDIWVPRGNQQPSGGYQGKYFQALVEEEDNAGFARLDDLF